MRRFGPTHTPECLCPPCWRKFHHSDERAASRIRFASSPLAFPFREVTLVCFRTFRSQSTSTLQGTETRGIRTHQQPGINLREFMRFPRRFWRPLQITSIPVIAVVAFGAIRWARSAPKLPVADVRRVEFVDYVEVHSQVKALRSQTLIAPSGAGDLQILKMATNGATVKKGDVLVEFDASTLRQKHAQDRSAWKSAQAEIDQARAAA